MDLYLYYNFIIFIYLILLKFICNNSEIINSNYFSKFDRVLGFDKMFSSSLMADTSPSATSRF